MFYILKENVVESATRINMCTVQTNNAELVFLFACFFNIVINILPYRKIIVHAQMLSLLRSI